ncbi:membrane protein [Leptospira kobayashii]|uniref:Membrane protein n=1 Tax=Leptospira kobayashii TaxID=1917830 RepID=A0ABN6KBZ1_9LEPT|nr:CBS domain-containing protein [Leptospira kobayashii]BDA78130.1 membrane protein [Leptospira kobayashii]
MFFWIQEGISTPRLPSIASQALPKIGGVVSSKPVKAFDESDPDNSPLPNLQMEKAKKAYDEANEEPPPSPILFAHQVMTSPVESLFTDSNLYEARKYILEKRFRHIPILSPEGKLVGILSDRDVWKFISEDENALTKPLSSFMIRKLLTGTIQTEIREAAKVMLEEKIGSLPIIDEDQTLIGILTRTDLIRAIVRFPGFTLLA